MKKYVFPISALCLLAAACSDRPENILSEDKMIDVMTDLQIAEAYDRSGASLQDNHGTRVEGIGLRVLKAHGVSEAEMDSTLTWYGRNMDEYAKLYKKVDERLAKQQQKYARAAGESESQNAGMDLWPYGRHLVADARSFTDGIVMSIQAEELVPGEKLTWKMRVQGMSSPQLTLGVDYSDGSSAIVKNAAYSSSLWIEAELQTDTVLDVSRIFGVVNFGPDDRRVFVDSIQLTHQPRGNGEFDRSGLQRRVGAARRKTVLPSDSTANSSLVEDSIISKPSLSTSNSRGVNTRLKRLK